MSVYRPATDDDFNSPDGPRPEKIWVVPVEPVAQISVTDDYWGDIHLALGRYAVVEIGGDDE